MGTNNDENEINEREFLKDIDFVNKRYQIRLLWVENELYLGTITYAKED